jgi:DNA-binding NtrC family response regulator
MSSIPTSRIVRHDTGGIAVPLIRGGPVMDGVLEVASRAAANGSKVLITGESGVGKDLVARFIHAMSPRARNNFVAINCAGLTETLLESELFGHVKGSFTGAYRDSRGKLQLAHGGTIFLDEIGEMTPRMQALLLRFLETGELQTVGDSHGQRVDVRVITATNRDLRKMVAEGRFRDDLFYRIRVVEIRVPPLRNRPGDVRALAEHFLAKFGSLRRLTGDAVAALERHWWPGNVRELQNVIEQVVSMSTGVVIEVGDLPPLLGPNDAPEAFPCADRRRDVADQLYLDLLECRIDFWTGVYTPFMERNLTRHDLRGVVQRGLAATRGNHREMLRLFHVAPAEYKRFLNFLARHGCSVDFRPFRDLAPAVQGGASPTGMPSDVPLPSPVRRTGPPAA